MLILFYKKHFNRRFSIYDQLQMDKLSEILPGDIEIGFENNAEGLCKADVVIFDMPFLYNRFRQENLIKFEHQLWVGWCLECEENYPELASSELASQIDLWMTYHQNADIVLPYYDYTFTDKLNLPPVPKEKEICMFISSPVNQSKRLNYLQELMEYIPIDSYGNWQKNCTLNPDEGYTSKLDLIRKYKFTIAFENAIGKDYVTEKFFDPLIAGSVPVYLGAPNIEDFAPGAHSFINVKDFPSPKELANILLAYCRDEEKYQTFFKWKGDALNPGFQFLIEHQKIHPFERLYHKVLQQKKETKSLDHLKVSVIIPYYNNIKTITNTVQSVLNQTHANFEILIVDDGSDISLEPVITALDDERIQYYQLPHGNANIARNAGVEKSSGEYLAFLDADDQWLEDHLELSLKKIVKENADGIYGSLIVRDSSGRNKTYYARLPEKEEGMINYLLRKGYGAQTSTLVVSHRSAKEILWDESLKRHQDYDFIVRYSEKYSLTVLNKPTVIYYLSDFGTAIIDLASCIQFIKNNEIKIETELYHTYHYFMLNIALKNKVYASFIDHYRKEATRYPYLLSFEEYIFRLQPKNKWEYVKLKLRYIHSILKIGIEL